MFRHSLIAMLFSVSLLGCRQDVGITNLPDNPTQLVTSLSQNGVRFTLTLQSTAMSVQDTLKGSLEVLNVSAAEKTFGFSNQQQLGIEILKENSEAILSLPQIVQPAGSSFRLSPSGKKIYDVRLLSRNTQDGAPLPTGVYWLDVSLLDNNSPKLRLAIAIN